MDASGCHQSTHGNHPLSREPCGTRLMVESSRGSLRKPPPPQPSPQQHLIHLRDRKCSSKDMINPSHNSLDNRNSDVVLLASPGIAMLLRRTLLVWWRPRREGLLGDTTGLRLRTNAAETSDIIGRDLHHKLSAQGNNISDNSHNLCYTGYSEAREEEIANTRCCQQNTRLSNPELRSGYSSVSCTSKILRDIVRLMLCFLFLIAISRNPLARGEPNHAMDISSANLRLKEKLILDGIIGTTNYDKRIRPAGTNDTGPTVVFVNTMIRNVQTISDVKMEYSMQITFREQWLDSRLKFDNMNGQIKYLTLTEPYMVWLPDLFFKNEKEGHFHNIIMPNLYLRIFPDGTVLYSVRISLTLSCPMDLKLFPLDRQMCQLLMASYAWTTEDLVFVWKDRAPVQVTPNLHLPRFTLEKFITDYCNSKTNTGSYSCLRVDFVFKREFSYYLTQYYVPSCMVVIVSWVSFWLDAKSETARMLLGVTTLFTMSIQASSINNTLPPVSYTKAIDIWTGVCITFVFAALLEFALVNYASRFDKHREKLKDKLKEWEVEDQAALQSQMEQSGDHSNTSGDGHSAFAMKPLVAGGGKAQPCQVHLTQSRANCCRSWLSKFPTGSKRIDVISRIIFPMVFAFFNLAYWFTYL